jgi:hypothetical protein
MREENRKLLEKFMTPSKYKPSKEICTLLFKTNKIRKYIYWPMKERYKCLKQSTIVKIRMWKEAR